MSLLASSVLGYLRRPKIVNLRKLFGPRPNDRRKAEAYSEESILPAIQKGRAIVLNFKDTGLITQSFFHALLFGAFAEDMRRIERLRTIGADERQMRTLMLTLRLLAKTHSDSPKKLEAFLDQIEESGKP